MERNESAFDLDQALAMVEGDTDLLTATAKSFLEQNLSRRSDLGDAVARGDSDTVERIAHSLVGAAQNFGGADVERAARALVEAAHLCDTPAFATLYEHLETALSKLSDALSSYCSKQELRHVLIAEDDDVTRMRLESLLRKWDYRVTAVSRGDVALELLGSGPPHLAIVDWMMPGLDGLELCRALRARKSDQYTYVILVTAKDAPDTLVTGLEAGADDFIAKPVRPEELRVRLRSGERIIELQERLLAQRQEQRLHTSRDGLTGLRSRGRILELGASELERHAASGLPLSVVVVDIDGLKCINTEHGREAGDGLLREACERMQSALRPSDMLGRSGGDEFLALLPGTSRSEAATVAQRMCDALDRNPISLGARTIFLSGTAGVAEADPSERDFEALLKTAETSLQRAKAMLSEPR